MKISLWLRHALLVEDGAFSHKIDYFVIFEENLNLKGHLNCCIGSKVTEILFNGGIFLGEELHWEGSSLQHAQQAALISPRSKCTYILPWTKIKWIWEVCDSLGKPSLTSHLDYHWATAGIRVNSSSVNEGLMSSPLFLLKGNPILPMTTKDGCYRSCRDLDLCLKS